MRVRTVLLLAVMFVLVSSMVYSSKVYGTVYTGDLTNADDAIVAVNSTPQQMYVAKDGTYSFNLAIGDYLLNVSYTDGKDDYIAQQQLKIYKEGDYLIDLILLPDISDEDEVTSEDLSSTMLDFDNDNKNDYSLVIFIIMIVAIAAVLVYFILARKKCKVMKKNALVGDEDLAEKVIKFLENNESRVTQKDIRKAFPFSEAKISLVITELEHKGRITKIKKGKGNIIVLNKNLE